MQVDLVPSSTAIQVFHRIRSINANAGVVSCSRGKLDPNELEGLGAFDRLMRCVLQASTWALASLNSKFQCRIAARDCYRINPFI